MSCLLLPLFDLRLLDSGTGASAIYPLLACSLEHSWKFVATGRSFHCDKRSRNDKLHVDVDPQSLASAKANVSANNLHSQIQVIQALPDSRLLFALDLDGLHSLEKGSQFNFTMCNPPFYSSREEVEKSASDKEFGPNAVCTGADIEMITAGGESAFVCQMIQESLVYGERCR